MTIIQKPFKVTSLERQLYKFPSLNMDELMYLQKFKIVQNNRPLKKLKKKKEKSKETNKDKGNFILGINHWGQCPQTLSRLLRAEGQKHRPRCLHFQSSLEQRTFSSNMKLDWTKIHPREGFNSVHAEVLKTNSVVLVQEVSELAGRLKLSDTCLLSFVQKRIELVTSLLKVVQTSIVLNGICLSSSTLSSCPPTWPFLQLNGQIPSPCHEPSPQAYLSPCPIHKLVWTLP